MVDESVALPPDGYFWVEELSRHTQKDLNTIIWLCERQMIDSQNLNGRWAVRIVRTTSPKAGAVIVRDLKAGRDLSIGSVIGQYITLDKKEDQTVKKERIAQMPIRQKIEAARQFIRWTWYVLGAGALFFLIGIVLSWLLAAFMIIPALSLASQAVQLAQAHGDSALLDEAKAVWRHAIGSAVLLWAVVITFIGIIAAVQG